VLLSRSEYVVDYFLYYMHYVLLQSRVCTQLFLLHVVASSLFICFTLSSALASCMCTTSKSHLSDDC
jgi:hypothetical protein